MLEVNKLCIIIRGGSGDSVVHTYPILPCSDGLFEGFTTVFWDDSYGDILKEFALALVVAVMEVV